MGSRPHRQRSATEDHVWERLAAIAEARTAVRGRGRARAAGAPTWRRIVAGVVVSIALGWAASVVARAMRRESRPGGRIEFVDVDSPGAPAPLAR